MRIGFFTDGFLPITDGVATSVYESARELERRGHEVFIVAPKYPGFVDKNERVIRLTSLKVVKEPETRIALNLPDKGLRRVMSMDFDLIHGHSGGPVTLIGWEVARAKKIPFVVTYHTLWNRYTHYILKGKVVTPKMMEQATKIFGNRADYLIAPTERVQKELRSYGVKRPIKVVASGIDIEQFKNAKKGFLRSRLGLGGEPIMLFVGRLGREKSIDFLLKAFKEVYEKEPSTHFVIIGDGQDRKKLSSLAARLKISHNTHFLGRIESSEIARGYKDATVFVFSSTSETQGLVIPEALASGVPVVAVDDPAYESVEDGKNGYLVKGGPSEFAGRVLQIIQDASLRDRLSDQAVTSSEKFSIKGAVDLLESVYFELMDKRNKESVSRIMRSSERHEKVFVVNSVFWITVALVRIATFIFFRGTSYPAFQVGGQFFYHSEIGFVLVLVFLAAVARSRKTGLFALLILGIGLGLIMDEAWSIFGAHEFVTDYWSYLNLIPVVIFGTFPLLLRKKLADRVRFYINTREQKHESPKNPRISVVIPAYNEGEFIEPTLKSLLNQTYKDFEIIVVDNNSTDNTGEVAKRFGARVIVEKKPGVAAARNAGFVAARGEIVASTDADSVVSENWVEEIARAYDEDKTLVGFGGLNALYSGPVTARAAGRFLFPIFWKIDKVLSGGWNMAGFNMSVLKKAFMEIGGFNTDLKMAEDIDLAEKLRNVGKLKIDTNFLVFSSGRRYKDGLLKGLMAYAPWWISKVILRNEKPFEFKPVRSEKAVSTSFSFLPALTLVLVLLAMFYASNKY